VTRYSVTKPGFTSHLELATAAAGLLGATTSERQGIASHYITEMADKDSPLCRPDQAPEPGRSLPAVERLLGAGHGHGILQQYFDKELRKSSPESLSSLSELLLPLSHGIGTSLFHAFILIGYGADLMNTSKEANAPELSEASVVVASMGLTIMHMRHARWGTIGAHVNRPSTLPMSDTRDLASHLHHRQVEFQTSPEFLAAFDSVKGGVFDALTTVNQDSALTTRLDSLGLGIASALKAEGSTARAALLSGLTAWVCAHAQDHLGPPR